MPLGSSAAPSLPSPTPWRRELERQLAAIPASRRRRLRSFAPAETTATLNPNSPSPANTDTRALLDLASNDYLGLTRHPALIAAVQEAAAREGTGAGASRLVSGGRPSHAQLESALASWLGRERVLLFPSGFQANLAAVAALADRHSLVLADRLCHHSLLTGVRASGARLQRFGHNDLADLHHRLQTARQERPHQRLLVLSESLFSMQGTSPDVAALTTLCAEHGAALLLDEAHALGVLGPGGRGLGYGLNGKGGQQEIALVSGTFGKAFGSGGAFLAGNNVVMEWLLQFSGPFRYTTALAPPLAASALAALKQIQCEPRGAALLERAERWRTALATAGWQRPPGLGPILPLLVGEDHVALALQQRLEAAGLLSVAIRPPTVPEGTARLRLVLRHDLPAGTLGRLLAALGDPPCR